MLPRLSLVSLVHFTLSIYNIAAFYIERLSPHHNFKPSPVMDCNRCITSPSLPHSEFEVYW